MNRFNYVQSPLARLIDGVPALSYRQVRLPLVALGAALLCVAGTWLVETQRVARLDADLAVLQNRTQAAAANERHARRLMTTIARLGALRTEIDGVRRESLAATNTVARIGNDLPAQTWLTGVTSTPAGLWTIDGRSTRVTEIGTMLRRIQDLDEHGSTQLVSISATGRTGHTLDFVIGWTVP